MHRLSVVLRQLESFSTTVSGLSAKGTLAALDDVPQDAIDALKKKRMAALQDFMKHYSALIKANQTTADTWSQTVQRNPEAPCLIFGNRTWNFREIDQQANQFAHYLLSLGLRSGQSIGLCMVNRPEFVFILLGAAKIGVQIFLINPNVKDASFLHCIQVAGSTCLVYGFECEENIRKIESQLRAKGVDLHCFNYSGEAVSSSVRPILPKLRSLSVEPVATEETARARGVKLTDPFVYVFTSGTTGMPKAAAIDHEAFWQGGFTVTNVSSMTSADRIYLALPFCHASALVLGLGTMVLTGCSVVVASFSVSQFWPEVRRTQATMFFYIGELCRYLLATPPHPDDKKHKVRHIVGNGLRTDIWKPFVERFAIPTMVEFYGATEAPGAMNNPLGKIGACGFMEPDPAARPNNRFVKIDPETMELIRDPASGLCQDCAANEAGEYLVELMAMPSGKQNFRGYTDSKATASKVACDVFKRGDRWFRSGDLLKQDKQGFVFFVDRLGDTYRWKGENIATNEVGNVICALGGGQVFQEVNVYGVVTPSQDGKAGMAAVVLSEQHKGKRLEDTLAQLASHLLANLPAYACPVFLRVLPEMEITTTFKHVKVQLAKDGFDPNNVKGDPLFFFDGKRFVPLDAALHAEIMSGKVRL